MTMVRSSRKQPLEPSSRLHVHKSASLGHQRCSSHPRIDFFQNLPLSYLEDIIDYKCLPLRKEIIFIIQQTHTSRFKNRRIKHQVKSQISSKSSPFSSHGIPLVLYPVAATPSWLHATTTSKARKEPRVRLPYL